MEDIGLLCNTELTSYGGYKPVLTCLWLFCSDHSNLFLRVSILAVTDRDTPPGSAAGALLPTLALLARCQGTRNTPSLAWVLVCPISWVQEICPTTCKEPQYKLLYDAVDQTHQELHQQDSQPGQHHPTISIPGYPVSPHQQQCQGSTHFIPPLALIHNNKEVWWMVVVVVVVVVVVGMCGDDTRMTGTQQYLPDNSFKTQLCN